MRKNSRLKNRFECLMSNHRRPVVSVIMSGNQAHRWRENACAARSGMCILLAWLNYLCLFVVFPIQSLTTAVTEGHEFPFQRNRAPWADIVPGFSIERGRKNHHLCYKHSPAVISEGCECFQQKNREKGQQEFFYRKIGLPARPVEQREGEIGIFFFQVPHAPVGNADFFRTKGVSAVYFSNSKLILHGNTICSRHACMI